MNILQIGTTDKRGGASAVAWSLKEYVDKNGGKSTMFVADKLSKSDDVFVIKRNKIRRYLSFLFSTEDLYKTDWILKTKEFKEADVVHCHNLHGRFFNLATLQKMSLIKPVVWTLHDEWAITPHCAYTFEGSSITEGFFDCPNKEMSPRLLWHNEKVIKSKKKKIYDNSKLNIVVPSLWLKKRLEQSILSKHNIKLIYNGIDTNKFKKINKQEARKKLKLPKDKKIVLFLADGGINNPWKGWNYTMKVVKEFEEKENVIFLCVGNNENMEKENTKKIMYVGIVDNNILNEYYSACDVILITSLADNFPLIVLEAMSCGLPVVSFDTGGIKEAVIHQENGYIAGYKNIKEIIEGLNLFLEKDSNEIEQISYKNINRISQEFSLSKMLESYADLYQEIKK
ncbi:MAG: glycosyl transferase, group 1/2 family protein [uncultured bacterium]|nr:MAG: glycosyl transferase, group 1/2 family protein [uncultured bacterium]OGH84833.1 MAG: hypothetical protein A2488_01305 [Candidatus Magasanikbacteria bacterium RIFOXYC12_FULL_32_21b]HAO52655.1 hypothetical protein [Candidatus Magasanikbacteria bacterium]